MKVEDKHSYNLENDGLFWKCLTTEDQEELLLALEESEDPKNLLSHDKMKKKHQKWL